MQPVDDHDPSDPFSRSNEPRKHSYPQFQRFLCAIAYPFFGDPYQDVKNAKKFCGRSSTPYLCIRLTLRSSSTNIEVQTSPGACITLISKIFVCYSTPFFGDLDYEFKNAKNFCGRPSRSLLCSRIIFTASTTHFQGQTSPEALYPTFRRFLYGIAHHFFGDPDSDVKNAKKFMDVHRDLRFALLSIPIHF